MSGKTAVEEMLNGVTDKMVGFECDRTNGYVCRAKLFNLSDVANFEKKFPAEWITPEGNNVTEDFIKYAMPLIQGETKLEKENGLPGWQGLVWAGGCAALALAANTDYDASGVIIICALYLTRTNRKWQCLAGALLFMFELTAPLAFVLVWFYNGQRGTCSPLQKKAFYWFYPVHLALLACITNLLL